MILIELVPYQGRCGMSEYKEDFKQMNNQDLVKKQQSINKKLNYIMRFGGYQGVREQLAKQQFTIQMEWHDRLMKKQYEMLPKTFRENLTIGEEDRQEGYNE